MVSETRKQSIAWMEMDYSKHMYFRWKIKWWLEHLGMLGTMGETVPLNLNLLQKHWLGETYIVNLMSTTSIFFDFPEINANHKCQEKEGLDICFKCQENRQAIIIHGSKQNLDEMAKPNQVLTKCSSRDILSCQCTRKSSRAQEAARLGFCGE